MKAKHPAPEKPRSKFTLPIMAGIAAILAVITVVFVIRGNQQKDLVISGGPDGQNATSTSGSPEPEVPSPVPKLVEYIEITESCGPYYGEDACVNARPEPNTDKPAVAKLRKGMVLRVEEEVKTPERTWYKITFDEWLRYPERIETDWYVAGDFVRSFTTYGPEELQKGAKITSSKRIVVDRSEQMLYAYDGDTLFMKESVSTGLELTPTPRGVFDVYRKTPTRYMQGPIPGISDQGYDLPGVPWNLYFSGEGAVIHGAYWHDNFGNRHSHGCVNLPPDKARELYEWADLGMRVTVQE